jgi:hypothetical protein
MRAADCYILQVSLNRTWKGPRLTFSKAARSSSPRALQISMPIDLSVPLLDRKAVR